MLLLKEFIESEYSLKEVEVKSYQNLGQFVVVFYTHIDDFYITDEEKLTIDMLDLLAFTFGYSFDKANN